jgi:hypothetical protein
VNNEPIDEQEAAKRAQGHPYVTRDGALVVGHAPPQPATTYTPLTEADGDPIGRRVIWHSIDGHQRGLYVYDSPVLGADLEGVAPESAGKVFVPLVTEREWWQSQLDPAYRPNPQWVPSYRVWLDEAER